MVNTDRKRILETFIELVKVYSPPKEESVLAGILMEKLSMLSLNPEKDEFGNIIARLLASEDVNAKTIFFSAHLDVVEPCNGVNPIIEESENETIIKTDGKTVLGADDKAGIVMILEAITSLVENDEPHGEIELVLTLQEEIGLLGSKEVAVENLNSEFGYILDHSAPIGTVINKAPQHDNMTFRFKGKAAHAGLHPEEGINAILLASHAIKKMPFGKLGSETTANIGTISGGLATNIIPDECIITCEVRSHDIKKLNKYVEGYVDAANEAVKNYSGTSVKFERETEYKKIHLTMDEDVLQYAKKAAEIADVKFELIDTCGGSDANVFNYLGMKSVCLGCGYFNPHSTSEYITLETLEQGAQFVKAIIQAVIEEEKEE